MPKKKKNIVLSKSLTSNQENNPDTWKINPEKVKILSKQILQTLNVEVIKNAIIAGDLEAIRLFTSDSFNISFVPKDILIKELVSTDKVDILKYFIEDKKFDFKNLPLSSGSGRSLLFTAINLKAVECTKYLLNIGYTTFDSEEDLLSIAISSRNHDIAKFVVEKISGSDIDIKKTVFYLDLIDYPTSQARELLTKIALRKNINKQQLLDGYTTIKNSQTISKTLPNIINDDNNKAKEAFEKAASEKKLSIDYNKLFLDLKYQNTKEGRKLLTTVVKNLQNSINETISNDTNSEKDIKLQKLLHFLSNIYNVLEAPRSSKLENFILNSAKSLNDKAFLINFYDNVSLYHLNLGNNYKAFEYCKEALNIVSQNIGSNLNVKREKTAIIKNLLKIAHNIGEPKTQLNIYNELKKDGEDIYIHVDKEVITIVPYNFLRRRLARGLNKRK